MPAAGPRFETLDPAAAKRSISGRIRMSGQARNVVVHATCGRSVSSVRATDDGDYVLMDVGPGPCVVRVDTSYVLARIGSARRACPTRLTEIRGVTPGARFVDFDVCIPIIVPPPCYIPD